MFKATARELKRMADFKERNELIKHLQETNKKVVSVEQVAYCESIYGCGGYLLRYELNDGSVKKAFTGRSGWMYGCMNRYDLGKEYYI